MHHLGAIRTGIMGKHHRYIWPQLNEVQPNIPDDSLETQLIRHKCAEISPWPASSWQKPSLRLCQIKCSNIIYPLTTEVCFLLLLLGVRPVWGLFTVICCCLHSWNHVFCLIPGPQNHIISLVTRICNHNNVIFKFIRRIDIFSTSHAIDTR